MGHRTEKRSHKHKHKHHKHKHSHKDRKKERADKDDAVVDLAAKPCVEVVEGQACRKPTDSEPESGEIVEELANLGERENPSKAAKTEVGTDSENGACDPSRAPAEAAKPSVVDNGEALGSASEACAVDRSSSPRENGVDVVNTNRTEGGQSPKESNDNAAVHLTPSAGHSSPAEIEPAKPELSPSNDERRKHRRARQSPSSDEDPERERRRRRSRKVDNSRSRSSERSKDRAHRVRSQRRRSPSPECDVVRRRRSHSRSKRRSRSRSGGRVERSRMGGRGRRGYEERSIRYRRRSSEPRHRRRRRSASPERRTKRRRGSRGAVDSDDDEEYKARVKAALANEQAEEDEERLLEERRQRRQEILEKHKKQAAENQMPDGGAAEDPQPYGESAGMSPMMDVTAPNSSPSSVLSANPILIPVSENESDDANVASTDPQENLGTLNGNVDNGAAEATPASVVEEETVPAANSKVGLPVDDGDIFCDTPVEAGRQLVDSLDEAVRKAATTKGLTDAYDDPEGYYNFQIGEILDKRYEVFASKGKGVFSTVLRARDKGRRNPDNEHPEVAIKMIRSNDVMKKSGQMEEEILKMLAVSDPENKRHCIRLLRSFEYRGHLCLVFEPMAMNLRELINKFGRKVGLNIDAVGHYTAQLLVALKHLKNNKVLHADVKPDNILVNEKFSRVKLCDFGSSMLQGDVEVTPYLVSRFYRSPEVILGLPYDHPMDLWSIGCVIYELFSGKILFPGKTNNEMLKLMMDVKGPFPKKMLKKGEFAERHYENDPNMSFIQYDDDPVTKKPIKRLIVNPTVQNDFSTLLLRNSLGSDRKLVLQLAELLEKMMMLDPDRRMDLDTALRHPFVRRYLQRSKPDSSHPAKGPRNTM
ncbi:hypothetical protein BSKO_06402 [Bryopsis sp. KO-2023]|nr:hypothetical protein BSKO_06402 [Bryopsis sp. KO-2023]